MLGFFNDRFDGFGGNIDSLKRSFGNSRFRADLEAILSILDPLRAKQMLELGLKRSSTKDSKYCVVY